MSKKRRILAALAAVVLSLSGVALWAQEADPAEPAPPAPAKVNVDYEYVVIPESIFKDGQMTPLLKNDVEPVVKKILSGDVPLSEAEAKFDGYYTKYYFAKMTYYDAKSLAKLPGDRRFFFNNILRQVKTQEVHEHLVTLTFNTMKEYATKNYHPAVRYNAMLIISELNSKEAVTSGAQAALPLPYADARTFMINEFFNPKQLDAVRVAALLGILRHVDVNAYATQQYPPAVRQALVKQFLPVAVDKKVPADRDADGHAWVRSRVVEILAALGQAGWDSNILQAMTTIMGDKEEPMSLRYAAATAIGRMNLSGSTGMQGDEVAHRLANLALDSSREQLTMLEEEIAAEKEKLKAQGGGSYEGNRGYPGGVRGPIEGPRPGEVLPLKLTKQEIRLTLNQRLLKDRMNKIRIGLTGMDGADKTDGTMGALTGAKTPPPQSYVKSVRDAVLALRSVGDLKNPIPNQPVDINVLAGEMRKKIGELEMVAKAGGNPAAPAAPMGKKPAAEGPDEGPGEGPDAAAAPMKKAPPAADLPE
jgi:hypothetical protein